MFSDKVARRASINLLKGEYGLCLGLVYNCVVVCLSVCLGMEDLVN